MGRSVQDLIEANSQVNYDHFGYIFFLYCDTIVFLCMLVIWSAFHLIRVNPQASEYPNEFDIVVGKQMLFKVGITDGNLMHNWRNYAVKRTSDESICDSSQHYNDEYPADLDLFIDKKNVV